MKDDEDTEEVENTEAACPHSAGNGRELDEGKVALGGLLYRVRPIHAVLSLLRLR